VILLSGLLAATAHAAGDDDFYENQCRDQAAWGKIEALLKQVPNDQLVIRTYAMRLGGTVKLLAALKLGRFQP